MDVSIDFLSVDDSGEEFFDSGLPLNTNGFFQLCDSITIDDGQRDGVLLHDAFQIPKDSIDVTPERKMKLEVLSKELGLRL